MKKLLLLSLLVPTLAIANDACDHFNTSYDRTYCSAKLFLESDNELNEVYKELKSTLKPEVAKGLTQTQRDWIRHRDMACENKGEIDVGCNFKINRERTEYLRDRLRECKTGNCQTNAITKQSWYTY